MPLERSFKQLKEFQPTVPWSFNQTDIGLLASPGTKGSPCKKSGTATKNPASAILSANFLYNRQADGISFYTHTRTHIHAHIYLRIDCISRKAHLNKMPKYQLGSSLSHIICYRIQYSKLTKNPYSKNLIWQIKKNPEM